MKILLAFAALIVVVLPITPVAAPARESLTTRKPMAGVRRTPTIRTPSRQIAECASNDRKCEVERTLKGRVGDPGF
jgi:hypothetical protein